MSTEDAREDDEEHFHFRRDVGEHERPGWRERARRSRTVGPFYKVAVLVVGLAVICAGIAMLVLPGPGWAAIILGLVILAPDFPLAERILAPIRRFAEAAADRALDPKRRRQNLILTAIAIVFAAAVLAAYYLRYGLTYEPLPLL